MLTAYVASFVIGGAFIGLSLLSGDVDADMDADLDIDADADLDVEVAGPTVGDAAHGVDENRLKRRFNPMRSMRFWTFGLAGFGLTGSLLTWLELSVEPLSLAVSGSVGVILGLSMSFATRVLATPVRGAAISTSDYVGQAAVLAHAVGPGGVARVRVRVQGRERDLLARTAEPLELGAGAKVIILSMDNEGRAVIAPESEVFGMEQKTQEEEVQG